MLDTIPFSDLLRELLTHSEICRWKYVFFKLSLVWGQTSSLRYCSSSSLWGFLITLDGDRALPTPPWAPNWPHCTMYKHCQQGFNISVYHINHAFWAFPWIPLCGAKLPPCWAMSTLARRQVLFVTTFGCPHQCCPGPVTYVATRMSASATKTYLLSRDW